MTLTIFTFIGFTLFVAGYVWWRLRREDLSTKDGYFLGGRSLTGVVIAGSMLLTNISTEHLIGMNGSSYKNGFIIIAWEVTSALALVVAALYFVPRYLRMGLTTIPEFLELRFDGLTRTLVAFFLMLSFIVTLLPIVLYTGAINIESLFDLSEQLHLHRTEALWYTVIAIGVVGSVYAILGGLKAVAFSDTINGYGLFIGGLAIPVFALWAIGNGNLITGMTKVYHAVPERFNVIGARDSVLPFETLFTGLVINQLYFWCMNQVIIQRALGAKNLVEAQKGLLLTGLYKILIPIIIVLPGVIGFYYFGDRFFDHQDTVYPELVKQVMPVAFTGFFAAVVLGAVLSTFNSVLNSAATIFSNGIYKRHVRPDASDAQLVRVGKMVSVLMAVFAILAAPWVANAPDGLYQLLQQLNGIFFIPIASIILAGFFLPRVSAVAARSALLVGLAFYLITTFIWPVPLHFIHLWGIEFVMNVAVMLLISSIYPAKSKFVISDHHAVNLNTWKYAPAFSIFLVLTTLAIYWWLSR